LFSPQISSKSKNKETELKNKKKSIEKKRERKELQKSHEKGMNIFREEKNISTSNLLA
jgi:hypothetical protein